jgi:hypothetical protein
MIAALLLFAQIVPVPAEPKPVETTIPAIRANPSKFDGEVVRLHGWVNSCAASSCLVYERQPNAAGGQGASLSIAPDSKFDATIRPLLPTYVEFDARLNASCLLSQSCPGRAPVLTIVTLRGVVSTEPPPLEN